MRTITVLADNFEEALDRAVEDYFAEITEAIATDGEIKIEYGVPHYYDDGADYVTEEVGEFVIDKEFLEEHNLYDEYVEELEALVSELLEKRK